VAFLILVWTTALGYMERPFKVTREEAERLNALRVMVSVPAYNEDHDALAECVRSMLNGTRRPQRIHVVDDGSTEDYGDLPGILAAEADALGVELVWERVPNGGKRMAQVRAFAADDEADVFITVDSDSLLDRTAIEELLKPFKDKRVGSVAGIVVALNNQRSLLTRMTDLWFVVGQLADRSAMSTMGSVLVNCGPLAAYHAPMIRRNLKGYISETFFGRRVEFSDDSMLTLYALAEGYRAVQQPTAFAYTLMPEKVYHHLRQYLRWMRGATIRSVWRFRYLPLRSYAFWGHALGWVQMVLGTAVFAILIIGGLFINPASIPWLFVIPIAVGYAQACRYLLVGRSDESVRSQLVTVALSPLATLWSFVVLRAVRWYGMVTCLKTGSWGTRETVEVTLSGK